MTLFQQGNQTEAKEIFSATPAGMKPLPANEKDLLAARTNQDDLVLWLAYQEARALWEKPASPR